MSMTEGRYRFVIRRVRSTGGYPVLVFDREDRLHVPLTVFARDAFARVSKGTVSSYLNSILPFFGYLETDEWQVRAGKRWQSPPELVRQAVDDFLVQRLQCKIRTHRHGYQLVSITRGRTSTIRVFLSGLKLFYRLAAKNGFYAHRNPLIDPVSAMAAEAVWQAEMDGDLPVIPEVSGVVAPRRTGRLTDSYFRLLGDEWVPRVVDDPTLPAQVLSGGKRIGWRLREIVVTRLLFETGGRISEVVGLTLDDWLARGLLQEANAFSKGSHGVRVKFLRFSGDTAKLLRQYFDTVRLDHDPQGRRLETYLHLAKTGQIHPQTVPLFLTRRGGQLTPGTFRVHWNRACEAAGIDVDCHQSRHWYTTMAVRQIYAYSVGAHSL